MNVAPKAEIRGATLAEESGHDLIESLEASLDAAARTVEGSYEVPPHLRPRRGVTEIASAGGAWDLHCADGKTVPITLVGRDFVAAGRPPSVLVPAGQAVLVASDTSAPPQSSHASLIEELRGLAGFGATVEVQTAAGSFDGVLSDVGSDHLVLRTGAGNLVVGLEGIARIELVRNDAAL